jgi:aspartate-semialdehyde dehydrogenase
MRDDIVVGILGATGALGSEILKQLNKVSWRPSRIVPYASAGTTVQFVEYGDGQIAVEDSRYLDMGSLDLLVVAAPLAVAKPVVAEAVRYGLAVVDCSGSLGNETGWLVPWINPESLEKSVDMRLVSLPSAAALLVASVVGPLARGGIIGMVDATVMLGASTWGQAGTAELSSQVISLFNSGTPPRKVFEDGLAFDLLPVCGGTTPSGWTQRELDVSSQCKALTGQPLVAASLVGVPLFTGMAASITVSPNIVASVQDVTKLLTSGGVRTTEHPSECRPRAIDGESFAHFSRVRLDDAGRICIWVSMDNLTTTATAAVASATALLK